MHWNPEQWAYRAEGGKHIVVYNSTARKVLRIIKAEPGAVVPAESDKIEIERRLKFEKFVISPLLADEGLEADWGVLVWLPAAFVSKLAKRIEKDRPQARLSKIIPRGDRYAVLQKDFCNSINHANVSNIALELKPKCGWIPEGRPTCKFCFQQLEKIRRGKYESRSAYCPVDLFSPSLDRKRFALAQLIENPQNNLRFFLDGKLVYSMETMEQFSNQVCPKNAPGHLKKVLDELSGNWDSVLDRLCHTLGSVSAAKTEHCQASTYQSNENCSDLCSDNGPLRCIIKLQRLSGQSAESARTALEAFERLSPKEKEDLEAPSKTWSISTRKNPEVDPLTDVDIVRRHLISATAKDCSLIIVFNPPTREAPEPKFWIEIVDLDLKPPSKLKEHDQKESFWTKSTHSSYS